MARSYWIMRAMTIKTVLAAAALTLTLAACHPTEQNYKAAYDKSVSRTKENVGLEAYNKVIEENNRNNYTVNGDSIRLLIDRCNVVDGKPDEVKRYSVIVAEFKQKFNATSYRDRLRSELQQPAYIVWTATDQKYLVAVRGFDSAAEAAAFVKGISHKMKKLPPLVKKVWVLQRN